MCPITHEQCGHTVVSLIRGRDHCCELLQNGVSGLLSDLASDQISIHRSAGEQREDGRRTLRSHHRNPQEVFQIALLNGSRAQRIPSWPEASTPTRAEYICAAYPVILILACGKAAEHACRCRSSSRNQTRFSGRVVFNVSRCASGWAFAPALEAFLSTGPPGTKQNHCHREVVISASGVGSF